MPNTSCLNLFAYGTLMDREELALDLVIPPSEVDRRFRIKVAEAAGYRRVYNKNVPEAGGAILNLGLDKEASVVGILVMDITNQELGMLDASFPTHLPRKLIEVVCEGEKVPAMAYLAKQGDDGAVVSEAYEKRMLALVEKLGEPVLGNFKHHTYQADGTPRYRDPAPAAPEPAPAADPAGTS